jgi:hypothetical protein
MSLRRTFLCLVVITLAVLPAFSQVNTADILGRVLDPKGLAVPGAKVTVVNKDTGLTRQAATGDTGDFAVTLLPPGTYKVTVEKENFATVVYEKVELVVGAKQTLEVSLRIGSAREIVTVTEQPPLVETTRSDLGGSVSPLETQELPILDRNLASLALAVPGVRPAQGFDPTKSRVGNFSVNGSDGRAVDVNVDGGDNKDNVVGGTIQNFTLEGIQEFNVITNRYTAESGRALGAVVNVISKSGTNGLHGSLFGLFQNSSFNKIDFFSAQRGSDKPVFHRYHFGGSVGGPIVKDKLFFFGAYEHKREPGSISVEPNAFNELSKFPLAKPVSLLSTAYKDHLITVKVDHRISDRQNMSYRYGRERWENPNDQLGNPFVTDLTETQGDTNQFHDLVVQHNYSFSSTKVNSINIHFQDFVNAILQAPTGTFTLPVAGGGTATNPNIIFPSNAEIGTNVNIPQLTTIRKYQVRDDFSWILGRHNMKMGVNYIYLAKLGGFFFFGANGYQIFFWDDPTTILANPAAYPQQFATPGAVREIDFSGGNGSFTQRPHAFGLYYQDDYKITSRLTLNLGVRWDGNIKFRPQQLGSSLTDTNRTIGVLRAIIAANPSASSAADGLARAKAIAGNDDDLRRTTTSWKEFQPRIGFAWDPTGSGKQVIRGGYGIAYDQVFQNLTLFSLQQTNAAIYQTLLQRVDPTGPLPLSGGGPTGPLATFRFGVDPLPAPAGSGANIEPGAFGRINDPKLNDPYAQQWSIGWARQFGPDFSFSADYYHTLGIHESRVSNINPILGTLCSSSFPGSNPSDPRCVRGSSTRFFDAAFVAASLGAGRLEQINMIGTTNRSRFDGVTLQLKKRFSHGNTFQASYVISRSVSWGGRPTASYSGNGIAITPENQFKDGEYVPSIFDERHRVVISGVFQLPLGFEIAPIFQASSGRPFRFRAGRDNDGDGRTTIDRVCVGTTPDMPLSQRIALQVPGCPEVPQNALRGNSFIQLDTRFAKKFTFKEKMNLRLYYEVYNLFNRNNFCDDFGENASSSSFNKPLGYCGGQGFGAAYSGPLRSQFGFRFEF